MLKNLKELFKDSLIYGASSLLSQFASFFLIPFYTKELSPVDYGIFSISAICLTFLTPIAGLNMDGTLFRFYSLTDNYHDKIRYLSAATVVKTIGVIILVAFLLPLFEVINITIFEGLLSKKQYFLILSTFIVESFSTLTIAKLRSERKVLRIAYNNIITLIAGLGFSIYFVLIIKMKVDGVLLAALLSAIIKAILYLRESLQSFSFSQVRLSVMKKMLDYGLPLIPHKIQAQIIVVATLFIINNRLGIAYAGLYAVAQKMSKPFSFVVNMVQQSWTPYKFHIHKTENNSQIAFRDIISFYWLLLLFLWSLLSLFTPLIFKFLVDEKYWTGIPYVPFIMFVSLAQAFYFTVTTGFELNENQKKIILGSFMGVISMLLTASLTINFYPPYFFILSQAVAFFVMAFILLPEARRIINIDYPFLPALTLFIFSAGCITINHYYENLFIKLAVGLFLCLGFVYAMRYMLPIGYWAKTQSMIFSKIKSYIS